MKDWIAMGNGWGRNWVWQEATRGSRIVYSNRDSKRLANMDILEAIGAERVDRRYEKSRMENKN